MDTGKWILVCVCVCVSLFIRVYNRPCWLLDLGGLEGSFSTISPRSVYWFRPMRRRGSILLSFPVIMWTNHVKKAALKQNRPAARVGGMEEVGFWIVFDLHPGEVRVKGIKKRAVESSIVSTAAGFTAGFSVRDLEDFFALTAWEKEGMVLCF